MEGILMEIGSTVPISVYFAGLALLALAAAAVLLGYASEEEKRGNRLYWAEWPLPETDNAAHFEEAEFRLAA